MPYLLQAKQSRPGGIVCSSSSPFLSTTKDKSKGKVSVCWAKSPILPELIPVSGTLYLLPSWMGC